MIKRIARLIVSAFVALLVVSCSSPPAVIAPPPPGVWTAEPYPVRFAMSPFATLAVAVDASGAAVAAFDDASGAAGRASVKRWGGSGWMDLTGGAIEVPPGVASFNPWVAARPDGELVASWLEADTTTSAQALRAARWAGSSWEGLGAPISIAGLQGGVAASRVAATAVSTAIAYADLGSSTIQVAVFAPSGWRQLPAFFRSGPTDEYTLALEPDGRPVIAWCDTTAGAFHAASWNAAAGAWTDLPSHTTGTVPSSADIAIGVDGTIYATYDDQELAPPIRLLPGAEAWIPMGLPGPKAAISVPRPRVAVSSDGALWFTWGNPHVGVARWFDGAWELVSQALDTSSSARDPAIATSADGSARLLWNDGFDSTGGFSFAAAGTVARE